jgi:hypothetical protein
VRRWAGGPAAQAPNASCAASTALRASSREAAATGVGATSAIGPALSHVRPEAAPTQRPPIKSSCILGSFLTQWKGR